MFEIFDREHSGARKHSLPGLPNIRNNVAQVVAELSAVSLVDTIGNGRAACALSAPGKLPMKLD
jgi:hypothetical protein